MVKQGHYASVSRQKRLRQLKQRHQVQAARVIEPAAVSEFLLVRYHLTRGKQQRPVLRKTMQRFLTQWLAVAQETTAPVWSVATITKQTLQQFNRQLPWQGYALINQAFPDWTRFLAKEVPAVPLATRLQLSEPLDQTAWRQLLSEQLAINTLLGMFGEQLSQVTTAQVTQLQASVQTATGIDWPKVASLVAPITITAENADAGSQTWFKQLAALTPAAFNEAEE